MLVFFDFDGTLSAPRFFYKGAFIHGFPEEDWKVHYKSKKEDTFEYCLPVGAVKRYAERMKKDGHRLFVLTRTGSVEEDLGKKKFIETWYPGLFEEYMPVRHDADKIPVIRQMAEEQQLSLDQCELVEDTYGLVLQAISAGMRGTHVSNLYAEEEFSNE